MGLNTHWIQSPPRATKKRLAQAVMKNYFFATYFFVTSVENKNLRKILSAYTLSNKGRNRFYGIVIPIRPHIDITCN